MCTLHTRTYHSAHAARAAAGICVCTHMRASPATTEPPPPAGDALRFECGEKKIGGLPRNAQNTALGGLFFYLHLGASGHANGLGWRAEEGVPRVPSCAA